MKIPARTELLAVTMLVGGIIESFATDWYDYKPAELLVVKGGNSPGKEFSIVSGKNESGKFGIYLMDAQTKKVITKLEEVSTGLDTGPGAYRAHWSPDSKHVGISSRSDRHQMDNVIYRIEKRRTYLVPTPKLICHAIPDFCRLTEELTGPTASESDTQWKARETMYYSEIMKWTSPTRFVVDEQAHWQVKERDPAATVGKYGEVEKLEPGTTDVYDIAFDAEGECELLPADKARVISTHPGKKSDKD